LLFHAADFLGLSLPARIGSLSAAIVTPYLPKMRQIKTKGAIVVASLLRAVTLKRLYQVFIALYVYAFLYPFLLFRRKWLDRHIPARSNRLAFSRDHNALFAENTANKNERRYRRRKPPTSRNPQAPLSGFHRPLCVCLSSAVPVPPAKAT
jgi:hypothetical protein